MARPITPLRNYLKRHRITQAEFARRVGVSQPTICAVMTGKQGPSLKLLKRISQETGLSLDELAAPIAA